MPHEAERVSILGGGGGHVPFVRLLGSEICDTCKFATFIFTCKIITNSHISGESEESAKQ